MSHSQGILIRLARWQLIVMGGIILSFLGATVPAALQAHHVDAHVDSIVDDALKSVVAISTARGDLSRIDLSLERYVHAHSLADRSSAERLTGYRQDIDAEIAAYRNLSLYPGERPAFDEAVAAKAAVDRSIDDALSAVKAGDEQAAEAALAVERRESHRTDAALERIVLLNAEQAQQIALRVGIGQRSAMWSTFVLDGILGILGLLATVLGAIALRRYVRAVEAERRNDALRASLLQERSSELEQFAGRVAHDILSPLMAVGIGLQTAKSRLTADAAAVATIERSKGSLMRVRRTVTGLLDFARAGAHPDPNATANLREVAEGVVEDVRSEAHEARVALVVDPSVTAGRLACAPGVLSSLLANLVRNAIKYMDESEVRRVIVRAARTDTFARVEVEDTGPGIPVEIQSSLFDPFFRAGGSSVPGSGLGLATVKKLAQAHGGSAGCRSEIGSGSVFWFELPRAQDEAP